MKTIFKFHLFAAILFVLATGCTKQESRVVYTGGTAPVLTAQTLADVTYANAALPALNLNWSNPNYTFNTGVSSLDVSYNVEIDTATDFSNPAKKVISVSKDLSYTFLATDLNDLMLNQLVLKVGVPHNLQMRIVSTLANSSARLVSNTVQATFTPYSIPPKVPPPSSGQLFLVGDATAGGWTNPVPVPSQQFKQMSPTMYQITTSLIGGKQYLLLPVNGDWSHKYAVSDNTVSGLSDGGSFGMDLSANFPGPANSGTYTITVDFQRGVFTVTPQ